ncbi:hypothetical protein TNCV_1677631 [Trichonephila clavipes]|nr:hypothetical protein TNCV_1677631 [Trichonephila clavipes]
MVNQARYKNNRSIQFSFGVVMLSCKVAASVIVRLLRPRSIEFDLEAELTLRELCKDYYRLIDKTYKEISYQSVVKDVFGELYSIFR